VVKGSSFFSFLFATHLPLSLCRQSSLGYVLAYKDDIFRTGSQCANDIRFANRSLYSIAFAGERQSL